jgi:uncharacterized delta-60 repeat protein
MTQRQQGNPGCSVEGSSQPKENTMRLHKLLAATALATILAAPAWAGQVKPVVDVTTDKANDLRGLTFGPGGKIYASGHVGTAEAQYQTVVARFNADGSPDAGFGTGGIVTLDLAPGRGEQSLSVAALSGGDVVVAVNATDADGGISVYLLRFDDKGVRKVAPAWGDAEGKVEVVFGWANKDNALFTGQARPQDTSWDLRVDRSGGGERLVVFGLGAAAQGSGRTDNDRYVVRLNAATGAPDPAFNGGKPFVYHSAGVLADNARRGIVEPDGSIVAAGYTGFGNTGAHVILVRLTPAGALDTGFGNFISPADAGQAAGVNPRQGVGVLNPFRVDGGFAEAYGVARQRDGSYVTTGYGQTNAANGASTLGFKTSTAPDLVTFRVKNNAVDTAWGNKGAQAVQSEGTQRPSAEDRGRHLVALPDDRTVHIGRFGGIPAAFVFTKDGQLDATVDGDGIIELANPKIDAQFFNVALSADGKRVAATTNAHNNGARLVVLEVQD